MVPANHQKFKVVFYFWEQITFNVRLMNTKKQERRMKKHFLTFLGCLVVIVSLVACSPAIVGASPATLLDSSTAKEQNSPAIQVASQDSTRTILVTGTGSVNISPDLVRINIGVRNENADVSKAISENTDSSTSVKKALVSLGVKEVDIQTSNFSVYANPKYDTSGKPLETTYAVENTLSVTVRDITLLGKLLGEVTRAGANNIYGITFDAVDHSKAIQEARDIALKNAQQQAAETAQTLGVTLGNVHNAEIITENMFPPSGIGLGGGGGMAAQANVPISAGQLVVTVNVNMSFEIK
jgi:uncharacterized protein